MRFITALLTQLPGGVGGGACETGLGKEVKREGLVGLTTGLMYAGTARVVMFLWNVNDEVTSFLISQFYSQMLQQGKTPAAAFRAAQLKM